MKIPFRQISKFKRPKEITQSPDQFGCVAFTSFGFVQDATGEIHHIKNPDFNWRGAKAKTKNQKPKL